VRKAGSWPRRPSRSTPHGVRHRGDEAVPRGPGFNTICNATALRQQESTGLAGMADVMFVLGGYNSANTRRWRRSARRSTPDPPHRNGQGVGGGNGRGRVGGRGDRRGVDPQWIIGGFLERLKGLVEGESIQVSFYR